MPFHLTQKLITVFSQAAFFLILFFSFLSADLPAIPSLTPSECAAILAFLFILPMGHPSSFRFVSVSLLSVFFVIYNLINDFLAFTPMYGAWRRLTLGGLFPFPLWALYQAAGFITAKHLRSTRYVLSSPRPLPKKSLRIVQISDLHPGRWQTFFSVRRLFQRIRQENPDLLIITGDLFDEYTPRRLFSAYSAMFGELHPPYGIFYVAGNHELRWHWKRPSFTLDELSEALAASGVRFLRDETAYPADVLRIVGRRDLTEERLTPAELLQNPFSGLTVLLCHEPVEMADCAILGADLLFAGHTHGGQIFPLGILSHRLLGLHEYNAGCYPLPDGTFAIVSSGTGTWCYPIRTEGRSEIVIVDVIPQDSVPESPPPSQHREVLS